MLIAYKVLQINDFKGGIVQVNTDHVFMQLECL